MNADEVLGSIELLAGARIVGELAGGPASDSYLVERGVERFVLRLDHRVVVALGLDRSNEVDVLRHVSEHGLGPKPEFVDLDRGILVTRYIEGRSWTEADLRDGHRVQKLATLMRTLHRLEPIGRPFDLRVKIQNYARIIGTGEGRDLAKDTEQLLCELDCQTTTQCLCHNDLSCANIIEGRGLALIDWEYAAVGDPFFDLAVVAEHHQFDQQAAHRLLAAYCGQVREEDARRLDLYRALYDRLRRLWLASVEKSQQADTGAG